MLMLMLRLGVGVGVGVRSVLGDERWDLGLWRLMQWFVLLLWMVGIWGWDARVNGDSVQGGAGNSEGDREY